MQCGMCDVHSSEHFPNKKGRNVVNGGFLEGKGKVFKVSCSQVYTITKCMFSDPEMTPMNPATASYTHTPLSLKDLHLL